MTNTTTAVILPLTSDQRDNIIAAIWDMGKEATGVRPRWIHFSSMDDDQLIAEYHHWLEEANNAVREENERQAAAAVRFEARIADLIAIGAGDRETAIRWLKDADDCRGLDDLEYYHDLPWQYLSSAA